MRVWLILKTLQFYFIKLATDFYWQPSHLLGWKILIYITLKVDKSVNCIWKKSLQHRTENPEAFLNGKLRKLNWQNFWQNWNFSTEYRKRLTSRESLQKGRISTVNLLALTRSDQVLYTEKIIFHHESHLNEEVKCTEPSPSRKCSMFACHIEAQIKISKNISF